MKITIAISTIILSCSINAQEFYMCENDGVTVFSQQPCGDNAKQVTSQHKKVITAEPSDQNNHRNIITKNPKKDMLSIKIYTVNKQIKRHNNNISTAKRKMTREIDTLKKRTLTANNNLAGAIFQDALSEEMIAVSNKYTAIIADEERLIIALKSQVVDLQYQLSSL